MNSSLVKPLVIGLTTATAAVGLVVQRLQVQSARAENAGLQARIAAAESSVIPSATPAALAAPQLTRDERAELLRLRGEVSRLRKELAQLAKSRSGVPAAELAADPNPAGQDEVAVRKAKCIDELKNVGLGIRVMNTSLLDDPELRSSLTNLTETLPKVLVSREFLPAEMLANVDILIPSVEWMIAVEQYPQAIMARSKEAYPNSDGTYVRLYCLGDGSVQAIQHEAGEESYGWGQITDGSRPDWLVLRSAQAAPTLQMDPELARRYGLIPSRPPNP